jgi:VCBS repeat-containing protein
MPFNVSFSGAVSAVQQAAVQAVATFFNNHFLDPVTVDITVQFGAISGLGTSNIPNSVTPNPTFTQIRNALVADATSPDDNTAVASLPATDPIVDPPPAGPNPHTWNVVQALGMAMGLIPDDGTANDGTTTFRNTATFDYDRSDGITAGATDFFGVVAHEFSEIMGRATNAFGNAVAFGPGFRPLDLFNFSAANTRNFVGTAAGYFSIDSGTTNLDNFNTATNGDFGDWAASAGNDAFDAFSRSGVINDVSPTDLREMDVIGWQVQEIAPSVTPLTGSVGEDGPSFTQNLLQGTSDADNDVLFVTGLDTSVTTTGAIATTLSLNTDYKFTGTPSVATLALTLNGSTKFNSLAFGTTATATFHYNVNDGITITANTLTLTINGANDPPTANPDVGTAGENETKSFDVLGNDTDPDVGDTKTIVSIDTIIVASANEQINGIDASAAFSINSGQIKFIPGTLFDKLALGQTATAEVDYTMADGQNAKSSSKLTLTINGEDDAPVIQTGGGGDGAAYWVRVNNTAVTTVHATDIDTGDAVQYSIVGGRDANLFTMDNTTGALAFKDLPVRPHQAYVLQVQASDGHPGGTDAQTITVNVAAAQMGDDSADKVSDTFVFHPKFGANTVSDFDIVHDFLQFDKSMFAADTATAVLNAASDDGHGNVVITAHAGHLKVLDTSVAVLAGHPDDFRFV